MQFNADVADGMPWKFVPTQREVLININVFYVAMGMNVCQFHICGICAYNFVQIFNVSYSFIKIILFVTYR